MIADGRLRAQLLYNEHVSQDTCLKIREKYCTTYSQFIRYFNDRGRWVVEVHQYLRGDGTIGASGRPDPKRLRLRDTVYVKQMNSE